MDELFDRIRAAYPNPLLLTDDELARLEAWVKAHGLRLSYVQRYNAWKAHRASRPTPEIAREVEWRCHLKFVLEYNRNRPKAALSAGSESPPVEATSQSDIPNERGYVASPADPAAYVPASDVLARHTPADLPISMKELGTILADYDTNRVRWTRPLGKNGQPMRNRRSVHLGDWTAYVKRRSPNEADGFPRLTDAELEQRKAAVRNARHAGK
jgi:hypothetical protein